MGPLIIAAGAAGLIGGGLAAFSAAAARKAEAAVPPDGRFMEIGGNRLHYVDRGSGPPIVLVHGLAAQLRSFARPLVEDLARDHRVILVDRPGSGYSVRAPGASAGLNTQAEAIAGLIAALGLERPLLVGHSLGGAVSLAVALNHPDSVGALALVTPLTQVQEDVPEVFRGLAIASPALRRLVSWTLAVPIGIARGEDTLRQVFHPEPVPAEFPVEGGGLLAGRPNNFYEASTDMVAINDDLPGLVARYPTLRLPVSILYARQDNLLDYRMHGERTANEIPGAFMVVVEGGHMLPFTQPERTALFVRTASEGLRGGADGGGRAQG
jgi:pimeloyl-ACP methyl ester carboxylesterase